MAKLQGTKVVVTLARKISTSTGEPEQHLQKVAQLGKKAAAA
jgi:hypothetical protein